MMKRTFLTQEELREALDYNPLTGLFVWISPRKSIRVGAVAGDFSGRYVRLKFQQKSYPAHCLAWLYMTGRWPKDEIDHIDTNKHNNAWKNLREATRVQNAHNASPMNNKKYSRLKGVTYAKGRRKWMASIRLGGKHSRFIGYFDTEQEAHAAYVAKARETRGEFARGA
jgi:hypothetical protein